MKPINTLPTFYPSSGMFPFMKRAILFASLSLTALSCKKFDGTDRDFGYAKITVKCEKCSVSYISAEQPTSFTVEGSTAINYIRYKRNYNLDINVQSLGVKQAVTLGVYSRSGKEVYFSNASQAENEIKNAKIIIP
ncbi:hypothetical protein FPZ43_11390 [Mucilaginibacter pallidiroseus]|uniref:Uncharacterized protein n=1 Tax=Mucilaginibacter pallidiroseus TaxID=2599295 RepID=A0A563UBX7_9SPHI|nr:hypothetical protein [Mucilaginibacter pallidiroseus]TWR28867.1 hypothetical protein FPZ43_11390 [Mucilaginibacter pallidiroseus]